MASSRLISLWSLLPSLTANSLTFGAANFSSSVLCTLFAMYVTPVFTSVYQVMPTACVVTAVSSLGLMSQ